jgi:hypothetical protein
LANETFSSRKMRLSPGSWTGLTNISTLTDLYELAKPSHRATLATTQGSRLTNFSL